MKISRYLYAKDFRDEASKLKVVSGYLSDSVFERLEQQRSLLPRLRLHYPDEVERRWWAEAHPECEVGGELEPDGPRWEAACALEAARRHSRWPIDPTTVPNPLDEPEERFLQFIEHPADPPFVPWKDYRVSVSVKEGKPLYTYDTAITYYSSWQLLQFAEVVNMGVSTFMNLFRSKGRPTPSEIAAAPSSISSLPMHTIRGFEQHAKALDAIVWFSEEATTGYLFATRKEHGRRVASEEEHAEISRTRRWAASEAQRRHQINPDQLCATVRFLCEQWAHWADEGRPLIEDAYKTIAAQGVRLTCLVTGKTVDELRHEIGRAGGYLKLIMDVIWPDWAVEQREYARRVLVGYAGESALLRADFSEELIDRFLDFIDNQSLQGFYWRLESFHHHVFDGNDHALEGLKGDVVGMSVVLEHITSALGAKRQQLFEKFKELWAGDGAVLRLLKDGKVRKVSQGNIIDLDWFEDRNRLDISNQIAADLAIAYAIRGGAHRVIQERNQLRLEYMMLILLRAAVRTFDAATKSKIFERRDRDKRLPNRGTLTRLE